MQDLTGGMRRVDVDGIELATIDAGEGRPIVFLHGNPTSSWLWRGVTPHVADLGRVVVPDLLGMGASDGLPDPGPGTYGFATHADHLDRLLAELHVTEDVVFVVHDWGSALGFDWCRRHPGAVAGIAYTEAICGPRSYADEPAEDGELFRRLRGPEGERMVLEENFFVEEMLQAGTLRELSADDLAVYRGPYEEPGAGRWVMLEWARQIPFDGEPLDVHERAVAWERWLRTSAVPKLRVRAEPGALTGVFDERCAAFRNQTEVTVAGIHFVQEDSPHQIGTALRRWLMTTVADDGPPDEGSST